MFCISDETPAPPYFNASSLNCCNRFDPVVFTVSVLPLNLTASFCDICPKLSINKSSDSSFEMPLSNSERYCLLLLAASTLKVLFVFPIFIRIVWKSLFREATNCLSRALPLDIADLLAILLVMLSSS